MSTPPSDESPTDDRHAGDAPDPYRLPRHVRPVRYDVALRPDLSTATFDGRVSIDVEVDEPTDTMVLNAAELSISSCSVGDQRVDHSLDPSTERLIVELPDTIDSATTLEIEFSGVLNDKLRGFYRSTYVDDDGVEHVIATTQMQSTDCRRAFPCWDEPDMKAVFGITLDVEEGLTAVSNGRELDRDTAAGRTTIRFADTMPMSSYLVAFVVGRLEATEPIDVDGVPIRVIHVPGKGHLADYGLGVGAFSLRWFQEYYGIDYPSDKIDLLALPDFAAGAMENLGCITFRETALLVDPDTATQAELQNVVDTVAHEIAHMWFGDLVTMRWWNGIWLNEAFATFMEVAACDAFRPAWDRWTSFGQERALAFEIDALTTSRPVEFEVRSPDEAEAMFDVLTYQKGGALLRMLERYLGADRFRDGVRHYLHTFSYSNTETSDLWDALESTTGEPVRRLMDSWIWQAGFPQVTAGLSQRRDGSTALSLGQRRFLFDRGDADDRRAESTDGTETAWVIPVAIRNGESESTVLLEPSGRLEIELDEPHRPVIVNAHGDGFFRVAYDSELRSRLRGPALRELDTLERYGLVDDAWSASLAGDLAAAELLEVLEDFGAERELGVWRAITVALRGLSRIVEDDALDTFRGRVRDLVRPALDDLGEPEIGEPDLTGSLRGLLFSTAGLLGRDPTVEARSRDFFTADEKTPGSVHPELLAAATSIVAATGGHEDYERMLAGMRQSRTAQDELRLLLALADFDDAALVHRTCELAVGQEIRTQNVASVLRRAMANRSHGADAWAVTRDHWIELNERLPVNAAIRVIGSIPLLTDPPLVAEIGRFLDEHPIEQTLPTMYQLLERQRVNAAYRERNAADFARALTAPT